MIALDKNVSISASNIILYLGIMLALLYVGAKIIPYLYIIPMTMVLIALAKRSYFLLVFLVLIWHYIQMYYSGLPGYAHGSRLYMYMTNSSMYIVIAFILHFKKCISTFIKHKDHRSIIIFYIIYTMLVIGNSIAYEHLNLGQLYSIVLHVSSIYIYMLILGLPIKIEGINKLLNLAIAIILLQIIVSYMQVSHILPPPVTIRETAYYIGDEISPGFDDVASGTLGPWMSNKTSWLCTVGFLFLVSIGIYRCNILIMLSSYIILLQYATIDSKTAFGVTVFGLVVLLLHYSKSMVSPKRLALAVASVMLVYGIYSAIAWYYSYYADGGIERPQEMTVNTAQIIMRNFTDWGKVQGIPLLTQYGYEHNPAGIIIGFERGEADLYIQSKLKPVMMLNNTLNTSSHYLAIYYSYGIFAMITVIGLMLTMYRTMRRQRYKTILGKSFAKSGPAMVLATIVFCFLQGAISVTDRAFLMILILYALVAKYEQSCELIKAKYEDAGHKMCRSC